MRKYKKLSDLQKAQKALEIAKLKDLQNGVKPKYINQGVTGYQISGVKRW